MDNTAQQTPTTPPASVQEPITPSNSSKKSHLLMILIGLIILGIGLGGGYLFAQSGNNENLKAKSISEDITPSISNIESSPTETKVSKKETPCNNDELKLGLNIPSGWSCTSTNHGAGSGTILIKSELFDVTISNLGRGLFCGTPDPGNNCKSSVFYKNDKVNLTISTNSETDDGEIYGPIDVTSKPFIFIKYEGIGKRDLTATEKVELISLIDSIHTIN